MIPNAAKQTREHPVKAATKRAPRKRIQSIEPIDYEAGTPETVRFLFNMIDCAMGHRL